MLVSMDVIKINNGSSGHFDVVNVEEETPSRITNRTTKSGKFENQVFEGERAGRKRKTRRFKSRYKGKSSASKSKYDTSKKMRTRMYPQSEAPNNTNQFLMAEHTIENLDDKLSKERSRHRESSFTSVDTDEEQFYSSPEDEDEFLTKDFDDTYQSMHAEKFGNCSKAQLTKLILELEAQVEDLNKKMSTSTRLEEMLMQMNGLDNKDKFKIKKIEDVLAENEKLRSENEKLKKLIQDSRARSSSSSSSGESDSNSDSEMKSEPEENRIDQRPC